MLSTIESTIGIVLGVALIVFRKKIVRLNLKLQYKHAKAKQIEDLKQAKEFGILPYFLKFQEILFVVTGAFCIIWGLQQIIFPDFGEYFNFILGFLVLSVFASIGAGVLTFILVIPFLKVDSRYMKDRYPDLWEKSRGRSLKNAWATIRFAKEIDDPTLRRLTMRALVCGAVLFVILFGVFLFGFYMIIKATS